MECRIYNSFNVKLQHLKPNSIKDTLKVSFRRLLHEQGVTKCRNIYPLPLELEDLARLYVLNQK